MIILLSKSFKLQVSSRQHVLSGVSRHLALLPPISPRKTKHLRLVDKVPAGRRGKSWHIIPEANPDSYDIIDTRKYKGYNNVDHYLVKLNIQELDSKKYTMITKN